MKRIKKYISVALNCILLIHFVSCNVNQKTISKMENNINNPMICDTETGVCEMPGNELDSSKVNVDNAKEKRIKIIYFTDPICSSCWGIEPQLRKLKLEYGDYIDIEYHMGGLLKDWSYNSGSISEPKDVAEHWDEVALHYDMPIEGNLWLEDPLHSSYPPSIAFKAAQIQNKQKAIDFLRKIREQVFLQKMNITKWEHISSAANGVGLDLEQFKKDYNGIAEVAFHDDLLLAKKMRVRGFPTLFFVNEEGKQEIMVGFRSYEEFESKILTIYPKAQKEIYDTSHVSLFNSFESLTDKEFSVLSGIERVKAEVVLNKLCDEKWLDKISTKNGNLYFRME